MRKLHHISVDEGAVYFWRNGKRSKTALSMVEFNNNGHIPGRHRGHTNRIDNVPLLKERKKVLTRNGKGNHSSLRPKQNTPATIYLYGK